jgi:hypothetical protein
VAPCCASDCGLSLRDTSRRNKDDDTDGGGDTAINGPLDLPCHETARQDIYALQDPDHAKKDEQGTDNVEQFAHGGLSELAGVSPHGISPGQTGPRRRRALFVQIIAARSSKSRFKTSALIQEVVLPTMFW